MPSDSNVYKVQCHVGGDYHGSIPMCRVGGNYYNPRQVWVKVTGVWHLCYTWFTWTYSWQVGGWSACGAVGTYQYRSVWCMRSPDNVTMDDSYCYNAGCGAKPTNNNYCNCNCNCACACCCD